MAYPIGTRVVRGPTWSWYNQDGGMGNIGVILGKTLNEKWQRVQWPNYNAFIYRAGSGFLDVVPVEVKPLESFL